MAGSVTLDVNDHDGLFALNLTIIRPEKLNYETLLGLVNGYRGATKDPKHPYGKFPDFIEFTNELMDVFLEHIGGEGRDGDEFLGIRCLIDPDKLESHNVQGV